MTIQLEVKSIVSPDLEHGALPLEPDNCAVLVELEIGEKGRSGAEVFSFVAVTPKFLASYAEARWGRGYLVVSEFSWGEVERMVSRLLQFGRQESWADAAAELSKELHWEFDNYQENKDS